MPLPEIVVYSKPACCLCDKVREQLMTLNEKHQFTWREINILEDWDAYEKFLEEIPVIFVNGQKAFQHQLDEKRLISLLKAPGGAVREGSASAMHPES